MTRRNEVKTATDEKAVVVADEGNKRLAAFDAMYEDAEGDSGFEEADRDSYAIPFLVPLQKGSPQCEEDGGEYIEGAKPGMIYNTVSGELFDGKRGVQIIPCHYTRTFVEWRPRKQGGGFMGEHRPEEGLQNTTTRDPDTNRDILPNGNDLVDSRNHYVLLLREDGAAEPALITMASTNIKKSRRWMTRMQNLRAETPDGRSFTPPMYAYVYTLRTQFESNDKGTWYTWDVQPGQEQVQSLQVYEQAKSFRTQVKSGAAKAAHDTLAGSSEGDTVPADVDY